MDELKPCPFCGGEALLRVQEVNYGICGAWVQCTNCEAQTNYMNTHELALRQGKISTPLTEESRQRGIDNAIKAWNRRADAAPVAHGDWEPTGRISCKCSLCKHSELSTRAKEYLFCPNCGADMREVDHE